MAVALGALDEAGAAAEWPPRELQLGALGLAEAMKAQEVLEVPKMMLSQLVLLKMKLL